ncbi:MAG: hypothetical protein U0821_14150 [Chloroflexota bacterium]
MKELQSVLGNALRTRAEVRRKLGAFDGAESDIDEAITCQRTATISGDPEATVRLADALVELARLRLARSDLSGVDGWLSDAERTYQRLQTDYPERDFAGEIADLTLARGEIEEARANDANAIKLFQKALASAPPSARELRRRASGALDRATAKSRSRP